MVGGFFPSPGFFVYRDRGAPFREQWGRPYVIDAQSQIAAKGSGPIVPPRILTSFLVVLAKYIEQSPGSDMIDRLFLGLTEVDTSPP
jgi:hypothetical protein